MQQKYYGSGLIGLDVKPKRKVRINRFNKQKLRRWMMPALIAMVILGIFIMAGVR